jgi:hypothetical protein
VRGFGLDAALPQLLGKDLPPASQVGLARVEAPTILALGAHGQVHMRIGLVGVQHHHVAVIPQFHPGKGPGGILQRRFRRAGRHRQHDIEGFATLTAFVDARACMAPLLDQVMHAFLAFMHHAAVVFDRQPALLADVPKVRGDGGHAAPATGDLDHHLWRAAHDGGVQARPDATGTVVEPRPTENGRRRADDPVAWVEQAVTPLHEEAVEGRGHCHDEDPR